jgi:hypothetical protein
MAEIKFYNRAPVPMEMHKVKIVQKLTLLPVKERLKKLEEAGFNTFLLHKEAQLFKDLLKNNTKIYSDSFSPEQYAQYKKLAPGTWERNGQLILGKFTYDDIVYDIVSARDLMQL